MEFRSFIESKLVRLAVAGGIGIAALTACGEDVIKDGQPATVYAHEYDPPYETVIIAGKAVVPVLHPARYFLDVRQCGRYDSKEADANGCVTDKVDVDEDTYKSHPVGSTIVFK